MTKYVEGLDGYLFLANDTNSVLSQTSGAYPFAIDLGHRIRTCHAIRRFLCSPLGAAYRHVVVPNKETVYAGKLPRSVGYQSAGLTPINRYFDMLPDAAETSFYDAGCLVPGTGEVDTYPRTDTHWNMYGALRYLREALVRFGDTDKVAELDALNVAPLATVSHRGDLAIHADQPAERITAMWLRTQTAQVRFESPPPHHGYIRHYMNNRQPKGHQRAVVLHDSFTFWMLPFLAELYGELIMLLCPDFDPVLIQGLQPDVVWFFQCERFFVRCPSNEIDMVPWIADKEREAATSLPSADYLARLAWRDSSA